MKMIDVPPVEKEAYNPDRPISGLIQMQLIHLSTAERTLPPQQRTGINIATLHTEGQAAEYIRRVTAMLHPAGKTKKATKKKTTGKSQKVKKTAVKKSGKGRKTKKGRK